MFLSALFQQKMFKLLASSAMLVALLVANFGMASAAGVAPGAVYIETNQAAGNAIAIYNRATNGSLTLSTTVSTTDLDDKPTVSPDRFNDPSAEKWPDHWARGSAPASWEEIPEDLLLSQETLSIIRGTIEQLPENQRLVITVHDMQELSVQEICNILGISETNQRVLLHRGRARCARSWKTICNRSTKGK